MSQRELGDRLARYEEIAVEHDRRARDESAVNDVSKFEMMGDALVGVLAKAGGRTMSELSQKWPAVCKHISFAQHASLARAKRIDKEGFAAPRYDSHEEIFECLTICESPIEKIMLPWLVYENYWPLSPLPARCHSHKKDGLLPNADVIIVPQFAFVKFRVDFAIYARYKGQSKIVALECDGEKFHGARADILRNGYLASWGIQTIRAQGSEINKSPSDVSRRVANVITEWACGL